MINYEDKVLEYIEYGRLTFISEHKIFTLFLEDCLDSDDNLSQNDLESLKALLTVAINRLNDYDQNVDEFKTLCWEKYDEYYESDPHLSSYYRILVILFYEFTDDVDPSSQFTEIGLFLNLLYEIDESYPKIFYQKFIHEYNELIQIL